MKRLLISVLLAFQAILLPAQFRAGVSGYDDLYDSETVKLLKEHVSILASADFEGRKACSEGEAAAAEYFGKALSGAGIELLTPVSGEEFKTDAGGTSRMVAGYIQGCDDSLNDSYIVIGARLDNLGSDTYTVEGETVRRIYYGANGNASGLAMLLELAREMKMNRLSLRRSVIIAAFGATLENLAGSRHFIERGFVPKDKICAMVNLDMLGNTANAFYAYTSGNADMSRLVSIVNGDLVPIRPELTSTEAYPSDHRTFYAYEIPSVFFSTGRYSEHGTEKDTPSILDYAAMEKELEYVFQFCMTLSGAPAPVFDPSKMPSREDAPAGTISFADCDIKPAFLGNPDPRNFLEKWVYQYLKYPREAAENGRQGRVMVDFVIDEKGNVTDVKVRRGVSEALDAEAVRVIEASPRWRPGRHRGKKVRVALTLPVEFRLEKKGGSFGINGNIVK